MQTAKTLSVWANVQADRVLARRTGHFVGFVMLGSFIIYAALLRHSLHAKSYK